MHGCTLNPASSYRREETDDGRVWADWKLMLSSRLSTEKRLKTPQRGSHTLDSLYMHAPTACMRWGALGLTRECEQGGHR